VGLKLTEPMIAGSNHVSGRYSNKGLRHCHVQIAFSWRKITAYRVIELILPTSIKSVLSASNYKPTLLKLRGQAHMKTNIE
jgi:hypothetical protein